jgi:DNA-binding PadR family transcriptional regulator
LEPALLLLLHHRPAHGYTLIEQLRAFDLGDMNPSVIYRALRDMEERGWISSSRDEEETQGPPRRVYQLDSLGHEVLEWWMRDLGDTRRIIDQLLHTFQRHMEEGQGEHH